MLRKAYQHISAFIAGPFGIPALLLALALLAYGLAVSWAGFYWDDLPFTWIAHQYGPDGLARYFSTNRPYWGLLFRALLPLIGSVPWRWQVFAILWRWAAAVAFWGVVRITWPRLVAPAAWAAIFALLFPAFSEQFISVVFSGFFIVLTAFLLSLICTVFAVRTPDRPRLRLALTIIGLALSLVNLISMEYFFLLELIRPLLIWAALGEQGAKTGRERIKTIFFSWLPYLVLFFGAGIWRAFFFPYQTQNYQPVILQELRTQPLQAILALAYSALKQIWVVCFEAWGSIFRAPSAELGPRSLALGLQLAAAGFVLSLATLSLLALRTPQQGNARYKFRMQSIQMLCIGVFGLLLAGVPFWVTGVPTNLLFPSDRFNLPLFLGSVLVLAGLLSLLSGRRWANLLLALAVSLTSTFALSRQYQNLNDYRRDWSTQKTLFWQMTWRIPALKPGTIVLAPQLPLVHYTDNSLSAALNWVYGQDIQGGEMSYILFYPSIRLGKDLPAYQSGLPVSVNYLATDFHGSTDQMVAIVYDPPGCLRVLDPLLDSANWMVPIEIRASLSLASTAPIQTSPAALPPQAVFGPEPAHGWCYYFEKADLAKQLGDWQQVASLGDQAFSQEDYPNDPAERLPFIEGYAHVGKWEQALALTRESRQVTAVMQPALCRLWSRIDAGTASSDEKTRVLQLLKQELECP